MHHAHVVKEKHATRVILPGSLTTRTTPDVRSILRHEIARGTQQLIVDMKHVHAIDSAGVNLLVAANNSMAGAAGKIHIVHVAMPIYNLLDTMRLTRRIKIDEPASNETDGNLDHLFG